MAEHSGRQALLLIGPVAFFLIAAVAALAAGSIMNAFVIGGFLAAIASFWSSYIGLERQLYDSVSFVPAILLAVVTAILFGAVIWEAQRWVEGRSRKFWSKSQHSVPATAGAISLKQTSSTKTHQAHQLFPVLMWQSWRIALPRIGHWLLAMVGMSLAFLLSGESDGYLGMRELGMFVVPAIVASLSLLFCATIFQADHQGGLYRFYQQHVERPRWFWLTRLIPWLVVVLLLSVLLSFTLASVARLMLISADGRAASHPELLGHYLYEHAFAFTTVILLTALAIGQFWSMFVRNFVIAIVFSLISGGVVYWCIGRLIFLGESLTFFLLPLLATLFWATWYRSKSWLADRHDWRSYTKPIGTVLAVICLTLCGFVYHRAYSLEDVQLDTNNIAAVLWPSQQSRIDYLQFGTPAERQETAKMYRQAIDKLQMSSFKGTTGAGYVRRYWDTVSSIKTRGEEAGVELAAPDYDKQIRDLVKANQKSISLIIKASKRVACNPFLDKRSSGMGRLESEFLSSLMMANSLSLLETDRNDEALESILAFNRVSQRTANVRERDHNRNSSDLFYDLLIRWSERPGQDVDKIKKMIRRLEYTTSDQQPESFEYTSWGAASNRASEQKLHLARYSWSNFVEWGGEAEWFSLIHRFQAIEEPTEHWHMLDMKFAPQSPWEKLRAKRLLKQIAIRRFDMYFQRGIQKNDPVSYTHLTLPTILLV